jgi:hypothetical protein
LSEPTERQVLYALVAAGFLAVVGGLTIVSWTTGLSPTLWLAVMSAIWVAAVGYCTVRWRQTGRVLFVSIATFVVWAVGTLVTL